MASKEGSLKPGADNFKQDYEQDLTLHRSTAVVCRLDLTLTLKLECIMHQGGDISHDRTNYC